MVSWKNYVNVQESLPGSRTASAKVKSSFSLLSSEESRRR